MTYVADSLVSMDQSCFVGLCSQAHKLFMYMKERLSYIVLTMCAQESETKVSLTSDEAQD